MSDAPADAPAEPPADAEGPVAEEAAPDRMREALKRVAVALKRSDVPFALAGGYAGWVRGAPEPEHDVDFLVPDEAAERAAQSLRGQGFDVERPPEDWLFKVATDGVLVDVIHRTNGARLEDVLASATEEAVLSVRMPVIGATDVVVEKLLALDEHYCDIAQLLPTMRALREQVDWPAVRRLTADNPFAVALLFLLELLGVIEAA